MDKHAGPDFIIIGAMKCATSSIHDQLDRHAGISMSEPKEPNFFADAENWAKGMEWYESLFSSMPANDLKGESSTHYTKLPTYPECARRLREALPNTKLIYVMRDPIDRIVSQYIHEWSVHVIDKACGIDEAIHAYPILVEYSKYAQQLESYVELFGRDAILPVFFERVMSKPQPELERIAEHIGYTGAVCWQEDDAKNVSSQRQRRNPVLDKVLSFRAVERVRRGLLPESLRAKIRSRWAMNERPELSAKSLEYLYSQLDPDLTILGEQLGIDLCCQNFKDQVVDGSTPQWRAMGDRS